MTIARWFLPMVVLLGCIMSGAASPTYLIKDGKSQARIVIAPDAPRMVKLAAAELSEYLEQMTGAKIPVGSEPAASGEVNVFIGRSSHTDALGIKNEDLPYGAFRMVSGPDWLVLLGQDWDYESPGIDDEKWAELTGRGWKNPVRENGEFNKETGIWSFDEGGSLYAVYEYLRGLGFRWFMPGELGVVIPESPSVELTSIDKTVHPDFPVRHWIWGGSRFATYPKDEILFDRRVGAGARYEVLGNTQLVHGIRNVLVDEALKENHPEYYALIGTERDTTGKGSGHACFSSKGLQDEVAAYARAVFDHTGVRLIQLSPPDGFRQCECEDCRDMSPSDNVFGFIDRVAQEVRKTHPDRLILSAGYGSYRKPSDAVEEMSPNVIISINTAGRPRFLDETRWQAFQSLVNEWKARLGSGKILRVENMIYGSDPIPVINPRAMAREMSAMRGISMGERNEWHKNRDLPGSTHLNRYVLGRLYWDSQQDIEALLDDYYSKFYGPAAKQMKEAFDLAEANPWGLSARVEPKDFHSKQLEILHNQIAFWKKVDEARQAAGDTIYGKRIEVLQSEAPTPIAKLEERLHKLVTEGDPRAKAPTVVAADLNQGRAPQSYQLKGAREGDKAPELDTSFTLAWTGKELVVDVFCEEPEMKNLQSSNAVVLGDNVAILIETPTHSHYHIEVNPDGQIFDKSWNTEEGEAWSSQAVVEATQEEAGWRIKVRIPIENTRDGQGDPRNFVVGDKPTQDQPWFFNLGRARHVDGQRQGYLFSQIPEGSRGFHQPASFARLVVE